MTCPDCHLSAEILTGIADLEARLAKLEGQSHGGR
jgi:hypothetical protein